MNSYWQCKPTPRAYRPSRPTPPYSVAASTSTSAQSSGGKNPSPIPQYVNPEPEITPNYADNRSKFQFDDPSLLWDLQRRDSVLSNGSNGFGAVGTVSRGGCLPVDQYPDSSYGSCGSYGPPPPLTASSLTCSPPSSTISPKSGWSPIQADFASDVFPAACSAGKSRVPSPLRNTVQLSSDGRRHERGCGALTPGYADEFCRGSGDLGTLARASRPHVCLWGDDGPCDSEGFTSREKLNWHVQIEHLLLCPVPGCTQGVFESRDLVYCHIRCAHGSVFTNKGPCCQWSSNLPEAPAEISTLLVEGGNQGKHVDEKRTVEPQSAKDRALKMEMSIGTSKKRCREKLRTVLEKKWKRANGGTPRAAESPGVVMSRVPKLLETASFPVIWEHGVLPFLIEYMPKWCGPGHVISVTRGKKPSARRICIMTRRVVSTARRMVIAGHVRDLLPENHRNLITFVFSTGKVDRLVWSRGLSKEMPDDVVNPRNPFCYVSPCMGDSIGLTAEDGDEITATLGPCVTLGDGSYWLVNLHPFLKPFIKASQETQLVPIEHPSPADRALCLDESHDTLLSHGDLDFRIGSLTATSGFDLKTTRLSHDPYWEDCDQEPPLVVTDWALISASTRQGNMLRKFPTTMQKRETPITSMASIVPGATVCSTGRTSGFQKGQVCEIPAYVDGLENGTGKGSREWYIEEPYPYDNEEEWIRGGVGVEGDSGAAIIDCESNALIGQLWGRNKYFGPGPRHTFFTSIFDIFDDIQERCGEPRRPQLPQYRDEADRWAVYPVCRQCFDLRSYLDSRRSSRESMISVMGLHHTTTPDDLTSDSELATPKDSAGHLVRHVGAGDSPSFPCPPSYPSYPSPSSFATPSFAVGGGSGVVSPAPTHTFLNPTAAAASSPEVACVRSPYAQVLHEDDLYEPARDTGEGGGGNGGGRLGKRAAAMPLPLPLPVASGSQRQSQAESGSRSGKKRRVYVGDR
ncbi:hypothetical protein F4779DRAFT_588034 [Xylariaceae sp. FL0662B]|nr:hypothetical protein F4779DRAFT_588034 [Xylariaceae sp. FL0662B]